MRGSVVKKLRRASVLLHASLASRGQIPPPQSPRELTFQRRQLYRILKQRWSLLSNPKSLDSEIRLLVSNLGLGSLAKNAVTSSNNSGRPSEL